MIFFLPSIVFLFSILFALPSTLPTLFLSSPLPTLFLSSPSYRLYPLPNLPMTSLTQTYPLILHPFTSIPPINLSFPPSLHLLPYLNPHITHHSQLYP